MSDNPTLSGSPIASDGVRQSDTVRHCPTLSDSPTVRHCPTVSDSKQPITAHYTPPTVRQCPTVRQSDSPTVSDSVRQSDSIVRQFRQFRQSGLSDGGGASERDGGGVSERACVTEEPGTPPAPPDTRTPPGTLGTDRHPPAPTSTDRHRPAPTDRHRPAPTGSAQHNVLQHHSMPAATGAISICIRA